jgi:hypothetical protein
MSGNFTYTWNSAFLATPQNTENFTLGAQRIRETRGAFGERFSINHSLNGDGFDGYHLTVQLRVSSAPTAQASVGTLYAALSSGNTELFYQDSSGNVLQITSAGHLANTSSIPSGTNMLFVQGSVPIGWTLNMSATDCVLRLNSGGGGGTGGNWTISGVTIGNTALSVAQLPPHTHSLPNSIYPGDPMSIQGGNIYGHSATATSGSTGSGEPHTHSFQADGSWRPAYQDAIIGSKN